MLKLRPLLDLIYFPAAWMAMIAATFIVAGGELCMTWMHLPSALLVTGGWVLYMLLLRLMFWGAAASDMALFKPIANHRDKIDMTAELMVLSLGTSSVLCLLSYLAAASPLPLIDAQLNGFDRMLGFDWPHLYSLSRGAAVDHTLSLLYTVALPQFVVFILYFGLRGNRRRLYEIYWDLYIAALVTIIISAIFPSLGPASVYWTPDQLKNIAPVFGYDIPDVTAIRAHMAPDFTSHQPTGIINFPSFHTVCAIIGIWAFRGGGALGWTFIFVNLAALASIPVRGDHYLADMLAGAVIGIGSIGVVKTVLVRVTENWWSQGGSNP